MSRGIRGNTLDRILAARARDPLAIGPLIGELAVKQNIPASLIAEMVETHPQTVTRWIFGQGEIPAQRIPIIMRVLTLLVYRRAIVAMPLSGDAEEKREALRVDALAYRQLLRADVTGKPQRSPA